MRCALYLRPAGLATWPHFDDVVKGWLREQGYEPVDESCYDAIVCLPYDGARDYYHCNVSVAMAQRIVDFLAVEVEVRWIRLGRTEVDYSDNALEEVGLDFADPCYGGRPTLAIMSEGETAEADREIRQFGQLADQDLGVRWRPPPPPPPPTPRQPRAPGAPFYEQVITLGGRRS